MKEELKTLYVSNHHGSFFNIASKPYSQYNGLLLLQENFDLYKVLEDIRTGEKYQEVIPTRKGACRKSKNSMECFSMEKNSLHCLFSDLNKDIYLDFDIRKIYDFNTSGRIHNIEQKENAIIIKYKKFSDDNLKILLDEKFVVVRSNKDMTPTGRWIKKEYSYDKIRNTEHQYYVYEAIRVSCSKDTFLSISFHEEYDEAHKFSEKRKFSFQESIMEELTEHDKMKRSVEALTVNDALLAGHPWFFQIWSRDELISLGGLLHLSKFELAKNILKRHIAYLKEHFLVNNRYPFSELESADATGWLFKRIHDYVLCTQNMKTQQFTEEELREIYDCGYKTIKFFRKNKMRNGFVHNEALETWMDTHEAGKKDTRKGYRVEIQCLYLNMLKTMREIAHILGKDAQEIGNYEHELIKHVRERLVVDDVLLDGLSEDLEPDMTTRPNIFLAHYLYPELLNKERWVKTFDHVLSECWLEWGGLSSISKKSPLFKGRHTGMGNESYHRGDSWYFMNNIAATCMLDLSADRYSKYANKIYEASLKDMNEQGYIGCCSEISDAQEQSPRGCFNQAWSTATLLELEHVKHNQ